MFTSSDLKFLSERGSKIETVTQQIQMLREGVPPINIERAATCGDGIECYQTVDDLIEKWDRYIENGGSALKFVPASGAATRMFKELYELLNGHIAYSDNKEVKRFFEHIEDFAFYQDLSVYTDAISISDDNYFVKVVNRLLEKNGLQYGTLPKGLLKFHKYKDSSRTSFEEHLVEGALYAKRTDGKVKLHFTVSPDHLEKFRKLEHSEIKSYEKAFGCKFEIEYSVQKPSTDTIAIGMDGEPFRNPNGTLLFRPGGHGALIDNLNDISGPVIFIKNIDNVVPDKLKEPTITYKKALAGRLIGIVKNIHSALNLLDKKGERGLKDAIDLAVSSNATLLPSGFEAHTPAQQMAIMYKWLNRPIRVCGMVKNTGEPGGGPFWVKSSDGSISLQVVESSQVDLSDSHTAQIFNSATHFNPVDLVCYVNDYKDNKFDLKNFVDNTSVFISEKTSGGKKLKALELPGLWNGAMANWITVFIEVPLETFNPVKSVNDLLRPQHQ